MESASAKPSHSLAGEHAAKAAALAGQIQRALELKNPVGHAKVFEIQLPTLVKMEMRL